MFSEAEFEEAFGAGHEAMSPGHGAGFELQTNRCYKKTIAL
jgi:hypothetical protein